MASSKRRSTKVVAATMREFRAAPAKLLRRAARTGARLKLGEFVLEVHEEREAAPDSELYGSMANTGRLHGDPVSVLSADDEWSTDG